jgi:hypothetical protein
VQRWAQALQSVHGDIDARSTGHCFACGLFGLSAPPIWLAVYLGDRAIAEALLKQGASADAICSPCERSEEGGARKSCSVGGQSPLHVAVARGSLDCVQRLCALRASPDAKVCFALRCDADEPEWNDATGTFEGGLTGMSALQLAAGHMADSEMCTLLLEYGADTSMLSSNDTSPPPLASLLRPLKSAEGETIECPICLMPVLELTAQWTPCCVRAFHEHCISALTTPACPMCRTRLPARERGHGRCHGAASSSASAAVGRDVADWASGSASMLEVMMRSTAAENRERTLALSFRSAAFEPISAEAAEGDGGGFNGTASTTRERVREVVDGYYAWRRSDPRRSS